MEKEIILKATHVKKYFPITGVLGKVVDNVKAVDDVSLEIYRGETYGLVGENRLRQKYFGPYPDRSYPGPRRAALRLAGRILPS